MYIYVYTYSYVYMRREHGTRMLVVTEAEAEEVFLSYLGPPGLMLKAS